jgi:ADP-L-glycero-D-manno-heptose 6-epimerase
MKIVVTGAAGFIGSRLIAALNARGIDNILAVDDLTQGQKFANLASLRIADYMDIEPFYAQLQQGVLEGVEAVFHQGACSDTMEGNGKYMLHNNYTLSCQLWSACQAKKIRFLYASSASVYGISTQFTEDPAFEKPLNVYGYSKLLFDQHLRRALGQNFEQTRAQVVGFRYFNVYGWGEAHKERMASVAFHQFGQFQNQGKVKLFGAHDGYGAGEQRRDFVCVDDVVAVNLWFFDHPEKSGLFNLGTGKAQTFNEVATTVLNTLYPHFSSDTSASVETTAHWVNQGRIEYILFPTALVGKYQSYTQADLSSLRAAGCPVEFAPVEQGVAHYMKQLLAEKPLLGQAPSV